MRQLLSLLFVNFCLFSFSQQDTTTAFPLTERAAKHIDSLNWVAAIDLYEEAIPVYKSAKHFESSIRLLLKLAKCYYEIGANNKLEQTLEDALLLNNLYLAQPNSSAIAIHRAFGRFYNRKKGEYQSAIQAYEKAYKLALQLHAENVNKQLPILVDLANCHGRNGAYDLSIPMLEDIAVQYATIYGKDHYKTIKVKLDLAIDHFDQSDYKAAISILTPILPLLNLTDEDYVELDVWRVIGAANMRLGQYDKAKSYFQKALENCPEGPNFQFQRLKALKLTGAINFYLGNIRKAIEYAEQSYEVLQQTKAEENSEIASMLQNLGVYYNRLGYQKEARQYLLKALDICERILPPRHTLFPYTYSMLGVSYSQNTDDWSTQKAIYYFDKAIRIDQDAERWNEVAITFVNIIATFAHNGNHEMALEYANRLEKLFAASLIEPYPTLMLRYNQALADLYAGLEKTDQSIAYYQKSIELHDKLLGAMDPQKAEILNALAGAYLKKRAFTEAKLTIEAALQVNTGKSVAQTSEENAINKLYYLISIGHKAELFFLQGQPLEALDWFEKCDQLTQQLLQTYHYEEDLLTFFGYISNIYEKAIAVCKTLNEQTNDPMFLDRAFYFIEQNKANGLQKSLAKIKALEFAGVPDSIIQQEYDLRVEMLYFNNKFLELSNAAIPSELEVKYYKDKWLNTSDTYNKLIKQIEQDYPRYFQLKYKKNTIDLSALRQQLPKNTILIEYFWGSDSIYIFSTTKQQAALFSLSQKEQLGEKIENFRASLFDEKGDHQVLAHELYQWLLEQPLGKTSADIDRIVIVPDGALGYLSFETLLASPVEGTSQNSAAFDFVVKNYTINYLYTAQLLTKHTKPPSKPQQTYGGFAPVYETEQIQLQVPTFVQIRNKLKDLPAARQSVQEIAKLFDGDAYLNETASVATFKAKADQYQILHLAMHGLVDAQNPNYSRFVFASVDDGQEDNQLSATELYSMSLNADLAVLGACNTGYGTIRQGEGILSLSKAFAYAGCPSMVASLWSVPDESTAQITQSFFQYLKKGKAKDEALRQAKLDYLANSPSRLTSPLFWGGIVTIGDASSITTPYFTDYTFWILATLLVALVALVVGYLMISKQP